MGWYILYHEYKPIKWDDTWFMININPLIYHIRLQSWIIPWSPYETSSTAPPFWPFSSNTLVGSARAVRLGPNARTPPSPWPQDQTSGAGRTQGKHGKTPAFYRETYGKPKEIPGLDSGPWNIGRVSNFFQVWLGLKGKEKLNVLDLEREICPSPQLGIKLLLWSGEWTIWVIWVIWVYLDKSPNPPTHHLVGK